MSWMRTLLGGGVGLMLGGPIGAVLGAVLANRSGGGGGARGLGRVRASARRRKREVPTVRDEAVGTLDFPPAGAGEGARGAPAKRRPRWDGRFARG